MLYFDWSEYSMKKKMLNKFQYLTSRLQINSNVCFFFSEYNKLCILNGFICYWNNDVVLWCLINLILDFDFVFVDLGLFFFHLICFLFHKGRRMWWRYCCIFLILSFVWTNWNFVNNLTANLEFTTWKSIWTLPLWSKKKIRLLLL